MKLRLFAVEILDSGVTETGKYSSRCIVSRVRCV